MPHYYDLVISSKINDRTRKYISAERMQKVDGELTPEEVYSILYHALEGIDKNSEQSALYSLAPSKSYSPDNAIALNSILNSIAYYGTKIELIEVANANSSERDIGLCCYLKIGSSDPTFVNFYKANLFSYVNDNATISQIESDLVDLIIPSAQIKDILNLSEIKDMISANQRLNVPYYSEDLESILKAYGIEFEIVGDFNV